MSRPTDVDPVKLITGTFRCFAKGAPALGRLPLRRFTRPAGPPASARICTRLYEDSGVSSAGFSTTVLPLMRAGIIFQDGIAMGKFHGVIIPQEPMDCRTLMANLSGNSDGVVWPNSRRPSPAM